jgi:hypothetical protein
MTGLRTLLSCATFLANRISATNAEFGLPRFDTGEASKLQNIYF